MQGWDVIRPGSVSRSPSTGVVNGIGRRDSLIVAAGHAGILSFSGTASVFDKNGCECSNRSARDFILQGRFTCAEPNKSLEPTRGLGLRFRMTLLRSTLVGNSPRAAHL